MCFHSWSWGEQWPPGVLHRVNGGHVGALTQKRGAMALQPDCIAWMFTPCLLSHRLSLPMWPSPSSPRTWVTRTSGCTVSSWPFRKAACVGSPGRGCWPQPSSCRPWPTPDSALGISTSPSSWVMGPGARGPGAFREARRTSRPHDAL